MQDKEFDTRKGKGTFCVGLADDLETLERLLNKVQEAYDLETPEPSDGKLSQVTIELCSAKTLVRALARRFSNLR